MSWMPQSVTPARVRVSELLPGIWVGRRARISPAAKLIAPCWIGDQALVEPRAVIGPGAIVEDRAVVERDTCVTQSWIAADTFVGQMTSVVNSLAAGSALTNWLTDSSLQVPDPFILCSLARPPSASGERPGRPLTGPQRAGGSTPSGSSLNWITAWHNHPGVPETAKLPGSAADQLL